MGLATRQTFGSDEPSVEGAEGEPDERRVMPKHCSDWARSYQADGLDALAILDRAIESRWHQRTLLRRPDIGDAHQAPVRHSTTRAVRMIRLRSARKLSLL
jgi:hypothetical protein